MKDLTRKDTPITKPLSYILVLAITVLVSFSSAKASHFAAADINLTYAGAGIDGCTGTTEYKYVLTLDVFRACEATSSTLGTTEFYNYGSVNSGLPNVTNIRLSNPQIDTLESLCAVFRDSNSCKYPRITADRYPAFIRHRYTDTVILPSAQTDWRFWWSSCCRNGGIKNLTNTGTIYIEAGLNNLTKYNNSTPRFLIRPLPYICAGQPATYLNGPYDINNDSLYVRVQEPLQGPANPIPYLVQTPPAITYSIADPIGSVSSNPFKFNNSTGTATFTPIDQGKYVMGFRCDEYERGTGIPLGYVMRDVQVSVFQCAAPPPPLDSLPVSISNGSIVKAGEQGNAVFVCPGSPLRFDITTTSPTASSNVYMEANTGVIPGSSFTTVGDGTNSVTGTFSWTPAQSDIGEHTLIVTSKDSTCTGGGFSIVLKNYTVLLLKVVNGIDAGADVPFCYLNPTEKQLFVKGTEFLSVQWIDINGGPAIGLSDDKIHNPTVTPTESRSYVVFTPDLKGSTCKVRDTVNVFVDTSNKINALPQNPVIQCRPDYVQLESIITGKPPVSNVPCGLSNPSKCLKPDTALIYGSSVYGKIGYDTLGAAAPILVNRKYTKKQQFLIRKEDINDAEMKSATINKIGFEVLGGNVPLFKYGNFTISMKCTDKNELKASAGFETGLTQVYSSANELLDNAWHDYKLVNPYNWDTTKNLIIEICYGENEDIERTNCASPTPTVQPLMRYAPTTYVSGLTLEPDTFTKTVCGIVGSPDIDEFASRPVFRLEYCEANPKPFTITWTPGKYLSDSTIEQPLAYVPQSTDYVVETFGRSGCVIRDTVSIYVPKHDFDIFPKDSSICFGETTPLFVTNGFSYKWYEYENGKYKKANSLNCDDCQYVLASPKKTTTYRVSVSDSVWCYDTVEVTVNVMKLPDTRILNSDTTIKYGQSVKLLATGARMYNWSPVSSLTNPNISYPIATPKEATRYVVGGLAANGCRSFDTLYVNVDYRDRLFVPSAFSPNGDGKNDVFKVANLSFQRIMEFRVFNRWGQEIFSGAGQNVSWDGTWKGVEQDLGNYSYLIRVGYPDGQVETYKGEVTIIR